MASTDQPVDPSASRQLLVHLERRGDVGLQPAQRLGNHEPEQPGIGQRVDDARRDLARRFTRLGFRLDERCQPARRRQRVATRDGFPAHDSRAYFSSSG